jgi:citronellol/citronellal dehydrogenase
MLRTQGFEGQVAVVTGATRGLGKAMALELARRGARVVLVGRSTADRPNRALPGTLEEVEKQVRDLGADCVAIAADIGREEDLARVAESLGPVDFLVNNAAVSFLGGFLEVPLSKWRAAMAVDLLAPVALCQAVLPGMLERGRGSIVSLSSSAALSDDVPQLPYSVAKVGLERLTLGLHREFGDRGVAVSCIRIDEVIPTEAVLLHAPDLAASATSTPDGFAGAITWALQRTPEQIGGRVMGLDDLRSAGALR